MKFSVLEDIGLTDKEAAIYEELLRRGPSKVSDLERTTEYKRGDLYNILAGLEEWGVVVHNEEDKTYTPEHPSTLKETIAEQEKELDQTKKELEAAMPELNSMFNLISGKPGIRFFEGKKGYEEAINDSLSATEEIWTIVDLHAVQQFADDINRQYVKRRRARGIEKKLLVPDTPENRRYLKALGGKLTNVRLFPPALDHFPTGLEIYNNKISYFSLEEHLSVAIIIESPAIYTMNRKIFSYLWQQAKPFAADASGSSSASETTFFD